MQGNHLEDCWGGNWAVILSIRFQWSRNCSQWPVTCCHIKPNPWLYIHSSSLLVWCVTSVTINTCWLNSHLLSSTKTSEMLELKETLRDYLLYLTHNAVRKCTKWENDYINEWLLPMGLHTNEKNWTRLAHIQWSTHWSFRKIKSYVHLNMLGLINISIMNSIKIKD